MARQPFARHLVPLRRFGITRENPLPNPVNLQIPGRDNRLPNLMNLQVRGRDNRLPKP